MERNIIVVQNVFDDLRDTEQSIKSIRYAAHRWKSNFYEITSFQFPNSPSNIFWDRLWACQNFLEYDKVNFYSKWPNQEKIDCLWTT